MSLLDKAKELQQQGARLKAEYRREKMMHIPVSTLEPILRAFVEMAEGLEFYATICDCSVKGIREPHDDDCLLHKARSMLARIKDSNG